ncbi:MAG: amino acid adenylation domain-containing protein [Lachnospiraceae bacterium]|nr:amino acid adenylation domain-containing protein [Lachnospiraceae bacterium]
MALCLHEKMFQWAEEKPDATALIYEADQEIKTMTYGQLKSQVLSLATRLKDSGVNKGDLVAVRQPRGVGQVIGIYAVLAVGAAYVPINVRHPKGRVETICKKGNIKALLTEETDVCLTSVKNISIANLIERPIEDIVYDSASLAYVIFTSGSTGEPKGVMISHGAAMNTIEDVNNRFEMNERDTGFNLSEIDFDLSVYDFFGILSAGGRLVLLNENNRRDPKHWIELVKSQSVTVWNSVPAIYEMLMMMAEGANVTLPLKRIFLSGDWISLELPELTKKICDNARFISLGGATEASIWSNFYEVTEVDSNWKSIPYGKALNNQVLMVVDEAGIQAEPLQAGELHIGGDGVALGYLQDEILTANAFYEKDGTRWYKTGDLAMEGEDGNYIILGRIDYQVKINGYRIELGEIENTIKKVPGVGQAVAMVSDDQKILAAYTKKKMQTKNCTVSSINDGNFQHDEVENRKNQVAQVMGYIMDLSEKKPRQISEFDKCNDAYQNWLDFLTAEGFVTLENGFITATQKLTGISTQEQAHYVLLKEVFYKRQAPETLLSSQCFAPERLILEGKETDYYLEKCLAPYLKDGKRIAILDTRTGLLAQRLLKLNANLRLTLLDESQGMLADAKIRMAGEEAVEDYVKYSDYVLDEKYEDAFDLVISANTLHTWQDINHALLLAEHLLKKRGTFLALEYSKMDSMGLLTSALIEEGFFAGNERKDPFRNVEEWQEALNKSNFEESAVIQLENTDAMILKGIRSGEDFSIDFEGVMSENLASYMMPQSFTQFMWYPLTENGKVDRKKIKEILQAKKVQPVEVVLEGTQKELWAIWQEYLGNCLDAPEKNFFEMGGDSLLATKLLVRVQKDFGVEISLVEMLDHNTVEKMAALIDCKREILGDITEGEI